MSDCCSDKACALEALRTRQAGTLKIVLAINVVMFAVEVTGGLLTSHRDDPAQRRIVIGAARLVEREPSLLGLNFHLMAIGRVGDM